jgi:DNA-binding XRE family transcriptional regulator
MSKRGGWEPTGFGARLKVLREAAGLSQPELAEKAGCHKFTVSKMERGTQEPAWPLVLTLCDALGVTCEEFRRAPGEPSRKTLQKMETSPHQYLDDLVRDIDGITKHLEAGLTSNHWLDVAEHNPGSATRLIAALGRLTDHVKRRFGEAGDVIRLFNDMQKLNDEDRRTLLAQLAELTKEK